MNCSRTCTHSKTAKSNTDDLTFSVLQFNAANVQHMMFNLYEERKRMASTDSFPLQQNGLQASRKYGEAAQIESEQGFAYFKGQIVPMSEAKVSIATHALQYGTACFEGIRAYWNAQQEQLYLLKLREHYQRLMQSCAFLCMKPQESLDDFCNITIDLLRKHDYHQDVYVRPLVYKATCTIKLMLNTLEDAAAIYVLPMGEYVNISSGLNVCTSSWRRANSNAMPVRAKSTGAYINNSLAVNDALTSGFDEAILLTHDGTVSEGSACNLFILRNGQLITPALSEDILEGITRNALIKMIQED